MVAILGPVPRCTNQKEPEDPLAALKTASCIKCRVEFDTNFSTRPIMLSAHKDD